MVSRNIRARVAAAAALVPQSPESIDWQKAIHKKSPQEGRPFPKHKGKEGVTVNTGKNYSSRMRKR